MRPDRRGECGKVGTGFVVTLLSLILGVGAATGAVLAVVNANGPQDSRAVQSGPKDVLPPADLIPYGG